MIAAFLQSLGALVAIANVLPILPLVRDFTGALEPGDARRYRLAALVQGNLVALAFLVGAPPLFAALALTIDDLRVAGGVVLLAYATHDILFSRVHRNQRQVADSADGAAPIAPLGVPILVGPATLSTVLVLGHAHGALVVAAAVAANAAINAACLAAGDAILGLLGDGASRAVGKVMSLVLAALGAGMLRAGLSG